MIELAVPVLVGCGSCRSTRFTTGSWRMHGTIAGSPVEDGGSGFVRVKSALAVLRRNGWFDVQQTVAEMRIRIGGRGRASDPPNPERR